MTKFWLLLPITLFLGLTFYQIDLPGLHYDEAFEVVPAVQLLNNQPVNAFRDSTLTLFGKKFPLTTQDYIGALNTYGSIPFLLIGGVTTASLRGYAIVIGLITLLLVYGFTAELSGRKIAGVAAAALLAVNPTFIFWTRQGIFVTAITAPIGVAAAWSWFCWQRRKDTRYALLGAFLFGLGLYAKLLFVWLIVALFGVFILRQLWSAYVQRGTRVLAGDTIANRLKLRLQTLTGGGRRAAVWSYAKRGAGLLLAGMLGCWPLIVYNLQTGGIFKSIRQNAATSYYGVDNLAVLSNLTTRIGQLITLLNGGHFWYLGHVYTNPILPIIFGLTFMASLWLAISHKKTISLIPFAVIGLVVLQSIVTVSALWITHFALIMTWPAIALSVTGADLLKAKNHRTTETRRFFSVIAQSLCLRVSVVKTLASMCENLFDRGLQMVLAVIFALLIITEGYTTWQYHQALSISGGLSGHSDAVYDMTAWLEQNATGPVVAMDWGLSAPVTYLTAGRVTPVEVFGYDWGDTGRFEQIIAPHLTPNKSIFLWRSPDETIFHRSADFQALYHSLDLEETILEAFYEQNGRPIYGVTQLVPLGTAKNKP